MKVVTSVELEILDTTANLKLKIQDFDKCSTYNNIADLDQLDALKIACSNVMKILGQPLSVCEVWETHTVLRSFSGQTVKFGLLDGIEKDQD